MGSFLLRTDQPPELGGEGSAPAPFDLFLASVATCAGIYVLGFCQTRGISTAGLCLRQSVEADPQTKLPSRITLHLTLPAAFPEKHREAIVRAAMGCKVKKTIAAQPLIDLLIEDLPLARAS